MQNDIDGASDALVFQTLLPVRREGEDTVRVAVQDIQVGLELRGIDLVAVDPDLEGAGDARLTNLLSETSDDRHVVVDENHVGRLLANYIGQSSEAEPLGHRLLESRRIDDINIGRVSSEIRRGLGKLLETEMSELEPGLLGEFIYEIVGDLGVSCELLEVGGDKHEGQLLCLGLLHIARKLHCCDARRRKHITKSNRVQRKLGLEAAEVRGTVVGHSIQASRGGFKHCGQLDKDGKPHACNYK